MRHIVYWALPTIHLLLSELANNPTPKIIPNHLIVDFELVLLDKTLLDPGLDGKNLIPIVPQNIRALEIRIFEIRFSGHRVDPDSIFDEAQFI